MRRVFFIIPILLGLLLNSCQKEVIESGNGITPNEAKVTKERLYGIKQVGEIKTKAVGVKDKLWKAGDTIRIKFLNGTPTLQERVKTVAEEWLKYAYVYFVYVNASENADVKIGFDWDEHFMTWSTIGTDCKLIPQGDASVNFFDMEYIEEDIFQGDVLRAFGHILGLGFENRNPDSSIGLNARAQSILESLYGLSEEEALSFIKLYNSTEIKSTKYDPNSIMILELPSSITTNRKPVYGNTQLSLLDKSYVSQLYPQPPLISFKQSWSGGNFMYFTFENKKNVIVDWGAGNRDTISSYSENIFSISAGIQFHSTIITPSYNNKHPELTISLYKDINDLTEIHSTTGGLLAYLNLVRCDKLESIYIETSHLQSLDLSKNTKLKRLNINDNYFGFPINFSNLTELESVYLMMGDGYPASINYDFSKNIKLERISILNYGKVLDVNKNINLTTLQITAPTPTNLEDLNLSQNTKLDKILLGKLTQNHKNGLIELAKRLPDRSLFGTGIISLNIDAIWKKSTPSAQSELNDCIYNICVAKNWIIEFY